MRNFEFSIYNYSYTFSKLFAYMLIWSLFRKSGDDDSDSLATIIPQVTAIVAYSKGFACACGSGTVHLYEKTDDKEYFKKTREIKVPLNCIPLPKNYIPLLYYRKYFQGFLQQLLIIFL